MRVEGLRLKSCIQKQVFSVKINFRGGGGSNDPAKLKSENEFVEQNRNLVHKCGFTFSVRASEQAAQKKRFLGIWAQKPKFS